MYNSWNPWHGCKRFSPGCAHCYVYSKDAKFERDSSKVTRTADFDLPLKLKRDKTYKLTADNGTVLTCFTSDFFIEDADEWRPLCFEMMKKRFDLNFMIITKRIHRFIDTLPADWGEGYDNVCIGCTAENQEAAEKRLPIFTEAPIKHRQIICEPLLSDMDISPWLSEKIEGVYVGGESGDEARICDFSWVLNIKKQCDSAHVAFLFHQTGANFLKDGRIYKIPRSLQQTQAEKAGLNTLFE